MGNRRSFEYHRRIQRGNGLHFLESGAHRTDKTGRCEMSRHLVTEVITHTNQPFDVRVGSNSALRNWTLSVR